MNKNQDKKKKQMPAHPKKDSIEVLGSLAYKQHPDEIDADDVYHDPKVPGKFAGDC